MVQLGRGLVRMKRVHINEKIKDLGFVVGEDISLGDFDVIGEWCAK